MGRQLLLDASALAKRYVPEPGSDVVDRIFTLVPLTQMASLMLGVGEVASVLVRRRNAGAITAEAHARAQDSLFREAVLSREFRTLSFHPWDIVLALPYVDAHGINITDAIFLRMALHIQAGAGDEEKVIVIASDGRLLRAARAEGLDVIDPETQSPEELDVLLAEPNG